MQTALISKAVIVRAMIGNVYCLDFLWGIYSLIECITHLPALIGRGRNHNFCLYLES